MPKLTGTPISMAINEVTSVPKIGTSGRVVSDRASGALSFTGDLSVFTVQRIRDHASWFALFTSGMRFDCGPYSERTTRPQTSGGVSTASAPAAPARQLTPAERLTGTFSGVYSCGIVAAFWLELAPKSDGTITGTFAFGPPPDQLAQIVYRKIGSYSLTGTWQENRLSLTPERWIEEPKGSYAHTTIYGETEQLPYKYDMIGVSGAVDPSGNSSGGYSLNGTIGQCGTFSANRDR